MKIVFICSSLEPGKDGVGDYTRLLAAELIRQGHPAAIIALHDKFVKDEATVSGEQLQGDISVPVLRLSSEAIWKKKTALANQWINTWHPHVLSLQYVPYGFHRKGLPLFLARHLSSLGKNRKWHIMFHELWIDKPAKWSEHVILFLQKQLVICLVSKLQPGALNVSLAFNKQRLKQINIESQILPLFGNIPYYSPINMTDSVRESEKLLYFGSAPRGAYLDLVIAGIEDFCETAGQTLEVILVTGESGFKQTFVAKLKDVLQNYNGTIRDCGFVATEQLSGILSQCTAGISRSEPYLLGKSGSAIAMLEHGLPVWLPKWTNGQKQDFLFREELVFAKLNDALAAPHQEYRAQLPRITKQFIYEVSKFS